MAMVMAAATTTTAIMMTTSCSRYPLYASLI